MESTEHRGPVRYDDAFPKLPETVNKRSAAVTKSNFPVCVKSQITREIIEIPNTERRSTENGAFGGAGSKRMESQRKMIGEIAKKFGVEIDVNSSKSQTLTVIINGPANKIAEAKRFVVRELQTQSSVQFRVPTKYHRFIIGRGGQTLKALEMETTTRINVSNSASNEPDVIAISGPKAGCEAAKERILRLVEDQSKLGSERLVIPKIYHPFIRGPRQANLLKWAQSYKVKIDMAPPPIPAEDICITGEKKAVETVAKEIQKIYKDAEAKYKTISVEIPKTQHRLVFGPGGSGLADILAETGVSVELPTDESDIVVLRGDPALVGRALSMVCEKSESSVRDEIKAPNRFHKLLIGRKGAVLAALMEGYQERVRVDFVEKKDKIELEGPREDVEAVRARLMVKLKELEATMAITKVKINTKYNGMVVGREGANIRRLKDTYHVQISINEGMNNISEITIEGDPKNIERASQEIKDLVTKLENEKVKDMIIEPHLQQLLRTSVNGSAPIRVIYDEYPNVSISWPEGAKGRSDPTSSVVQLQGQKQDVDNVADKLTKLLKHLKETNHHCEFRVYKEFRSQIFGVNSGDVRKMLADLQCRIQILPLDALPTTGQTNSDSQLIWIVGREKQVNEAIDKIEALQRKLANLKEIRVKVPSHLYAKVVGDRVPLLRSIREQCDGVSFKFPKPSAAVSDCTTNDLTICGPSDAVAKAEQLINALNAKVAELCEEVILHCDKKYHGFLIGRNGQNLVQFRDKHNVELLFPDKQETDPKLANEIRIVGNKNTVPAAKKVLEAQVKAMEDEVEVSMPVPSKYVRLINQARRTDVNLSRVRVIIARGGGGSASAAGNTASAVTLDDDVENTVVVVNGHSEDHTDVKLIGPKALVEQAKQFVNLFVEDMKVAVTKTYPVTDKFHARVLVRNKPQLPDWEVEYRTLIKVNAPPREQLDAMTNEDGQDFGSLVITGRDTQIEAVYEQKIRPLLPLTEQVEIPREHHWNLVVSPQQPQQQQTGGGRRDNKTTGRNSSSGNNNGSNSNAMTSCSSPAVNKVTELQQNFGVYVKLPPQVQTDANYISLNGTPSQIEEAKAQLKKWLVEWEAEKQDRIARSYELEFEVAERFAVVLQEKKLKLSKEFDVAMWFPPAGRTNKPNVAVAADGEVEENDAHSKAADDADEEDEVAAAAPDGEEEEEEEAAVVPSDAPHLLLSDYPVKVVLRGYKEKVDAMKAEIDALVTKMQAQVRECLNIPQEVHSQLIGMRRIGQQRIQDEFKVQVEFPGREVKGDAQHAVIVMGDQANVDAACDFLVTRATELLERLEERKSRSGITQKETPRKQNGNSFNVNHQHSNNNNNSSSTKKDFVVYGAPWSKSGKNGALPPPNTGSHSDFPSMNGTD